MAFDKKKYDLERVAETYRLFKIRREAILERLGGKCFLCDAKAKKGYHLHHHEYHDVESDYPRNSKSFSVRLKRLKEAEVHPERFKVLCPTCHKAISLLEYKEINLANLKILLEKH